MPEGVQNLSRTISLTLAAGYLRASGEACPGAGAGAGAGPGVRDVAGGPDPGQPAQDDDEDVRRRQEEGAQVVS